jgi:hypothetical protein
MLRNFHRLLNSAGFGSSRRRCQLIALVIGIQLIYLFFVSNLLDDLLAEDFPVQRPINESLEELEARQYLEALVQGIQKMHTLYS